MQGLCFSPLIFCLYTRYSPPHVVVKRTESCLQYTLYTYYTVYNSCFITFNSSVNGTKVTHAQKFEIFTIK